MIVHHKIYKKLHFGDNFWPSNFEDLWPQIAIAKKLVELVLYNNMHPTHHNKVMILSRNSSDESVAEPCRTDSTTKLFFSTFGDQTTKSLDSAKVVTCNFSIKILNLWFIPSYTFYNFNRCIKS